MKDIKKIRQKDRKIGRWVERHRRKTDRKLGGETGSGIEEIRQKDRQRDKGEAAERHI